ncbi:DUF4175 family protein [Chryseolinea sp. H1M3-3]|uniref:DUF4175 family protein n=1 Tax=Chryseolinea sp. H1M3-3 TaxID=3034144 RepID=UPI0023ED5F03|nr:DUF4175 family protein [Chryseolinea sp. H1M3-3]
MGAGLDSIHKKIKSFNKKYYLNIFVRGAILSLSILFSYFLLATVLEHNLWLGPVPRLLILLTFIGIAVFCVLRFLKEPLKWWLIKRGLSEEQSAKVIGSYVPQVKDGLLNLIQLASSGKNSALTYATIDQRSKEFDPVAFDAFINLNENKKYLKFLFVPVVLIVLILLINQSILTQSADRIVHFTRKYSPTAPFSFSVPKTLTGFYNEPYVLEVELLGDALPTDLYLLSGNQRLKFEKTQALNKFSHTFENLQGDFNFQLEAAGYFSNEYHMAVVSRPELSGFNVGLQFPKYIQRKNETLLNAGNLEIPEGTVVQWKLTTENANKAAILFDNDKSKELFSDVDGEIFTFQKSFKHPDHYEILLENEQSSNKEKISYHIDVIKDQYPKISVNNFKDSVLYKTVVLSGVIGDDYGVTKLALHFKLRDQNRKEILNRTTNIPISRNQIQQTFFHHWTLDSLKPNPGEQLEYFLEVWDNDGVNGKKSTKTSSYTFLIPTEDNLVAEIKQSQTKTQQKIDQSVGKANKLQDQLEQANQKLKGKQTLDWQDKKMLEDIIQQKEGLDKMVEELKQQNKLLEDKKDAFTEQDERIREKAAQIQKLMEELLDEETKKLFEELQKLLKENADMSQLQKLLDKLNQNTNNLEKELERTLELFKQLQYETKLDQIAQNLKEQIEKQKSLLEKTESLDKKDDGNKSKDKNADNKNTEEATSESENEQLAKDQEALQKESKKTAEQIEELEKLGEEIQKNEDLPSEEDSQEIQEQQEQSKEMLKQNSPSKSKAPQQKALQKMKQMQQQMESAQNSMSMEMDMQNIESLRQIIHGLVKLSFDQENLMKGFNDLNQSDPRFNTLAQNQIKLKDDAKVLEDSLLALGKRDPFMGSIVTKEVGELNDHLDKVIEANRERRKPKASSEMQMTMTSINNLALMLDEHFDMMMQMMANAQPSMGKSKKKGQKPSLSQMQQQLNEKIQQLKGGGKSGRQLSEELAEMAAEQERIRRALKEMEDKMKEGGKMPGGDLPSKMEQTEMDLVNKQLTDQLIKRQQEILTRLLETEKSAREQDMDEERKGETAKEYDKEIPRAFEDYLRLKEKEVELLKTVPPKLYPYYKKEVNEYFKRIGN